MFSVFDTDKRVFRNTLEELYRLDPPIRGEPLLMESGGAGRSDAVQYAPSNTAVDAYKDLLDLNEKAQIHHAWEVMRTDFDYISERSTAFDAVTMMRTGSYDILPVLSQEKRVVGLFTYDLIFHKLSDLDVAIKGMLLNPVRGFIQDPVITAEPITGIRRIAEVMYRYNMRIMPITDSYGAVIGVVSYREVLNAISNDPPVSVWT